MYDVFIYTESQVPVNASKDVLNVTVSKIDPVTSTDFGKQPL